MDMKMHIPEEYKALLEESERRYHLMMIVAVVILVVACGGIGYYAYTSQGGVIDIPGYTTAQQPSSSPQQTNKQPVVTHPPESKVALVARLDEMASTSPKSLTQNERQQIDDRLDAMAATGTSVVKSNRDDIIQRLDAMAAVGTASTVDSLQ